MKLNFAGLESPSRENFQEIEKEFKASPILSGTWTFFAKEFSTGTHKVYHKLGFIPRDIIQTSVIGDGTISFNYAEFTKDFIRLDVTADTKITVRFLVGKVA